ncbi:MAG TPA: methyltransferase domain-containing protein [Gemmataceae bacterium]|nr:methyltransferase domain-containing protein [Gemmataceae bacterium]
MILSSNERARRLLERALPLLRCPACTGTALTLEVDAPALTCGPCGRRYAYANGILNLYTGPELFTFAQRSLQTKVSTMLYERFRWLLAKAVIGHTLREEVEQFRQTLVLNAGDNLLDVACGPGNFTLPMARIVQPGLVIGLDISPAQLARAATNLARTKLDNVLLVRGDIHKLPLRDGIVAKVNCAGGLHQFPDPAKALAEVARVMPAGGRFSGSTLARHRDAKAQRLQQWLQQRSDCHFVDLAALVGMVEGAGLKDYRHRSAPSPWFGYYAAAKA